MSSKQGFQKLRTPLMYFPKDPINILIDFMKEEVGLSRSQEDLIYQAHRYSQTISKDGDLYISLMDFFEYEKIARSWPIKLLNKMTESALLSKEEINDPSISGRKPTVYRFKSMSEIRKSYANKELSLAAQEVFFSGQSVSFTPSERYIEERPSTYIDILRTMMEILPSSNKPGSMSTTLFNLNGKEVNIVLRTMEGENVANDSDIKILFVLCMFAENIIYDALKKNQEISLTYPFEIEVADIVKALWDKNCSGGGYNKSVMDTLKRLYRTEISAVKDNSEFRGFWNHNEYEGVGYDEDELTNERSFRILPEYSSFFRADDRRQRVQFTLHRGIMNALKRRVEMKSISALGNPIGSFISNQIVKQKDVEILRLDLKVYGMMLKNENAQSILWNDLADLRNRFDSNKKYIADIIYRIKKKGIKIQNQELYRLDGLVYKIGSEALGFAKEEDFKKFQYEENLMIKEVKINVHEEISLTDENLNTKKIEQKK